MGLRERERGERGFIFELTKGEGVIRELTGETRLARQIFVKSFFRTKM